MMIQSLVENAIKHGLEPKADGGTLTVSAEIVHGRLAVTVADTGLGFGRADTAGTGHRPGQHPGAAEAALRRQGLDGRRRQSPSGTIVTITVPYQALQREGVPS
jgi:sensor histidine kinase YesM